MQNKLLSERSVLVLVLLLPLLLLLMVRPCEMRRSAVRQAQANPAELS